MAWKDGFVIEYTASGDEPHKGPRSCKKCIHLKDGETCRIIGKLNPEVGHKSWRWCGRFSEKVEKPKPGKPASTGSSKAPAKQSRAARIKADTVQLVDGKPSTRSLASKNALLAKRWDYEKNGGKASPETISAASELVFWWKCPKCGGSFQAKLSYMMKGYDPCPFCLNKKVMPGLNDVATLAPPLASEWHSEKNPIPPSRSLYKDPRRAWWKCAKCGHVWRQRVRSRVEAFARVKRVDDCPECGSIDSRANDSAPKKDAPSKTSAKNTGSVGTKATRKKAKKKPKPAPNTFIKKGTGPLEKKRERPSGKKCKAEGCSRIADAGVFCKYHKGKA